MSMRTRVLVPSGVVAVGLLLAACGPEEAASAADATRASSTVVSSPESSATSTTDSPVSSGPAKDLEPVHCGEVTLDTGAVHGLIATPAVNGLVGCTEAFNVLEEFLGLPPEKRGEAALGNVELASGWSCTVDDGVSADISCGKDKVGDQYGFAMRTEQQAG